MVSVVASAPGSPSQSAGIFRVEPLEHAIEQSAHKAVAAADAVQHRDGARLGDVPRYRLEQICAHRCSFCAHHLAQRGGEHVRVRERLLHAGDHALETLDLGGKILAACFRPFDAQAELEIFLIADQDIRQGGDLREGGAQLSLAAFPEGFA